MPFQQLILAQNRGAIRPLDVQDLLFTPVATDPASQGPDWRGAWVAEHAARPRFYVGGLDWFLTTTRMTVDHLVTYREAAAREIQNSNWPKIPGASSLAKQELRKSWESISKPQFYSARNFEAILFPKAALVILSCELALADRLKKQKAGSTKNEDLIAADICDGCEVYRHLAIVPACWNIDAFNADFLTERNRIDATFSKRLADSIDQENDLILDLASGHTVTHSTAASVAAFCSNAGGYPNDIGQIRIRAGKRGLGKHKASMYERVVLDGD